MQQLHGTVQLPNMGQTVLVLMILKLPDILKQQKNTHKADNNHLCPPYGYCFIIYCTSVRSTSDNHRMLHHPSIPDYSYTTQLFP